MKNDGHWVKIIPATKMAKDGNGKSLPHGPLFSLRPIEDDRLTPNAWQNPLLDVSLPNRAVRIDKEQPLPLRQPEGPNSKMQADKRRRLVNEPQHKSRNPKRRQHNKEKRSENGISPILRCSMHFHHLIEARPFSEQKRSSGALLQPIS